MNSELNDKLKKLRQERGYSQQQLADKLNISRQAISKWENGKAIPDIENLQLLCEIYDVSFDTMFGNEKDDSNLESLPVEHKPKRDRLFELRHFTLICLSVVSYFLSPFGFITLAIVVFFIKKTDGHRLLIIILCILALFRNIQDTYLYWYSNPENYEHDIERVDQIGD